MGIQINGQTDTISSTDGSLNIGGTVTVNVTGDATGLTGTPNITVGVVTASSAVISGDLTVNGTTTTLDTVLTEVDKLEVGANNTTVGVAITQSGSGDILRLYDGATQAVTVKDGGNFGVGPTSPEELLHLSSSSPKIKITDTTTGADHLLDGDSGVGTFWVKVDDNAEGSNPAFIVDVAGTERLRITSSGNVGINTTTPISPLEIQGDGGVNDSRITFTRHGTPSNNSVIGELFYRIGTDSVAGIGAYRESAIDDAYLAFFTQPTGGSYGERLRIDSTGVVGLKVTPDSWENDASLAAIQLSGYGALHNYYNNVSLSFNAYQDSSSTSKYLTTDEAARYTMDSNGDHVWYTAPSGTIDTNITFTERLRITSNGNARFRADNTTSNFTVNNITGTTYVLDTTTPSAVGTGGRIVFGSTYYTQGNTMGTAYIGSYKENAPSNGADEYNHSLVFGNGNGEKLRITSAGSILHKGNNSGTVDNTDGDSLSSSGYPAGGATFNKNVSVNNGTSSYGQCMNMVSHTKSLTLDGSTNHDMLAIYNREGSFIGHIYAGYSTGGDGAVAMYKFSTFYSTNTLVAELGPSSRASDTISVNISSSNDTHIIRVNGNGYTGDVTVGVVFLSAGTSSNDHFGVRYY